MAENGRVHPDCPNASNPYHECGVACLERISQGLGRKDKKKTDYQNGKNGGISKKMDGNTRTNSNCPKATNPYHQCDKSCSSKTYVAESRGLKKDSGSFLENSLSFGRKKKGSDSQPTSPQVIPNSPAARKKKGSDSPQVTSAVSSFSPRTPVPSKPKPESQYSQSSSSSSQPHSDENFSQHNNSFHKPQITSSEIVPASDNPKPNGSKSLPLGSFTCFAIAPQGTKQEDNKNLDISPPNGKKMDGPPNGALNFTFSGISRATEDSDDDEIRSVISESCVSVGKYRVRSNTAPILQLILDKYGDIAANCKLESASLRAHYLECICSVVQELQSASFDQITKPKVKEFLAVLKDVGSVQIDVSWLRDILNGLTEAVEINSQRQAVEEAKVNCSDLIEMTKKEVESLMEDLAIKEKEVADAKAKIEETRARLSELEIESAKLSETILSLGSKVEKFRGESLAQQIL